MSVRDDGSWKLSDDDWSSQGRVLTMLAEHYLVTGDRNWLTKASTITSAIR